MMVVFPFQPLYHRKKCNRYPLYRGRVSPWGLDVVKERNVPGPTGNRTPVVQPAAQTLH